MSQGASAGQKISAGMSLQQMWRIPGHLQQAVQALHQLPAVELTGGCREWQAVGEERPPAQQASSDWCSVTIFGLIGIKKHPSILS